MVFPRDPDGVVPDVYLSDAPQAAALDDNGDGTRTFSWQPAQLGTYNIKFTVQDAQDASLSSVHRATIDVVKPEDVIVAINDTVQGQDDFGSLRQVLNATDANGFNNQIAIGRNAGDVSKVLTDVPVSASQTNVQQTSVASANGYLYVAVIEPGPSGDQRGFDLKTVLWQGQQRPDRSWQWESVVIDDRTMYNRWHSAPSVAVDKGGFIHIAYNMHNFPWQYKRSKNPHDIYNFEFLGQNLHDDEIKRAMEENRTSFPTLGTGEIPGNQITYPAFYKDKNLDLYVSYRFAAAPKRAFSDRMMSSGVAVYNTTSKAWVSIGGAVEHWDGDFAQHSEAPNQAIAMAGKRGWTSYLPKLGFDSQNNLLMSMMWREGKAGKLLGRPCVVRTKDRVSVEAIGGNIVAAPVNPDNCGSIGIDSNVDFYSVGSFAVSQDNVPYVLHSPKGQSRFMARYSESDRRWISEKPPENATEIFFDLHNNLYAVASGIKIFKRSSPDADWELIYDEGNKRNCYPSVKLDESARTAFIHTQSCDEKQMTVYGLRLP